MITPIKDRTLPIFANLDERDAKITVKHGPEFRRCLLELDIPAAIRLWKITQSHLPEMDAKEILFVLHLARTKTEGVPSHMKLYSQRWLNERGFGSFMLDETDKRER